MNIEIDQFGCSDGDDLVENRVDENIFEAADLFVHICLESPEWLTEKLLKILQHVSITAEDCKEQLYSYEICDNVVEDYAGVKSIALDFQKRAILHRSPIVKDSKKISCFKNTRQVLETKL